MHWSKRKNEWLVVGQWSCLLGLDSQKEKGGRRWKMRQTIIGTYRRYVPSPHHPSLFHFLREYLLLYIYSNVPRALGEVLQCASTLCLYNSLQLHLDWIDISNTTGAKSKISYSEHHGAKWRRQGQAILYNNRLAQQNQFCNSRKSRRKFQWRKGRIWIAKKASWWIN